MVDKQTVLVADDDQVFQELISDALKKDGYTVVQAFDGGATVELAEKYKPAFIVLDIKMPTLGGLDVAKKIRATEWGKKTPILMFTQVEDVDTVSNAIASGVMWYEVKSNLTINEVVDRVGEALNK